MLREMKFKDVDAVLAIENAVQHFPWTHGNFCDAINSGYLCRVDELDGVLRGYTILMPLIDEAELLTIGVAAKHQRKGLASAMLTEMLRVARDKKIQRVFLEVRQANLAAIVLYARAGFREIGKRCGYYKNAANTEDALVMACQLSDERLENRGQENHGLEDDE